MSVRKAERKLTGKQYNFEPVVTLGTREDGSPGVTVTLYYGTYRCFTDAAVVDRLIADLEVARDHLAGK